MLLAGSENLTAYKQLVDALNVFPVPDGDTGTNMSLTVQAAAREVENLKKLEITSLAQAASNGALMGARGNSGVILSQLFRGFSHVLENADKVDGLIIAKAFHNAAEVAYRAVIKPVEGTILTVARAAAKGARDAAIKENDYEKVIENALQHAQIALDKTPTMLPALAQAGVVDAGGKGLCIFIEGALNSLSQEKYSSSELAGDTMITVPAIPKVEAKEVLTKPQELEFRYCTELIIKGENLSQELTRRALGGLGDSLLVVGTDSVTKIHIHTNFPGKVLEYAIGLGTLHDIKIDNMEEQHQEKYLADTASPAFEEKQKEVGILGVCAGEGLAEILKSLGADYIISGGQTMNPSTEDLVSGIKAVHAKNVFVLPNNKNIILAAEQAKKMLADIKVFVIPTKNFPQGMSALLAYDPEKAVDVNFSRMEAAIKQVQTGELTYAVRESQYNGLDIQSGELLGIVNGNIVVKGSSMFEVAKDLVQALLSNNGELLTIFYGSEIERDEADEMQNKLQEEFSELEIEIHYGGQPLYYYIFALE